MSIGQVGCWQLSLALVGVAAGRPLPLPVAAPVVVCAAILLAMTVVRVRDRWLYEWARHYARFRRRERVRHLPRADGPRAVLHLFAPDAMVATIRLDDGDGDGDADGDHDGDVAVVNRVLGATTVLRPELSGEDPVTALPRPGALLAAGADPGVTVQLVLHGVAGERRLPLAWLAVQAVRTPDLADEDDLNRMLGAAVRSVLGDLAERGVRAVGLGRADTLRVVTSLAHVGHGRRDVRERWRRWQCGPVAQAAFRLKGWATMPDPAARQALTRLLTTATESVVTVSVVAGPDEEAATMRVAAATVPQLKRSVERLRAEAAVQGVRLDRMDGEHADGVATVLPLGVVR